MPYWLGNLVSTFISNTFFGIKTYSFTLMKNQNAVIVANIHIDWERVVFKILKAGRLWDGLTAHQVTIESPNPIALCIGLSPYRDIQMLARKSTSFLEEPIYLDSGEGVGLSKCITGTTASHRLELGRARRVIYGYEQQNTNASEMSCIIAQNCVFVTLKKHTSAHRSHGSLRPFEANSFWTHSKSFIPSTLYFFQSGISWGSPPPMIKINTFQNGCLTVRWRVARLEENSVDGDIFPAISETHKCCFVNVSSFIKHWYFTNSWLINLSQIETLTCMQFAQWKNSVTMPCSTNWNLVISSFIMSYNLRDFEMHHNRSWPQAIPGRPLVPLFYNHSHNFNSFGIFAVPPIGGYS